MRKRRLGHIEIPIDIRAKRNVPLSVVDLFQRVLRLLVSRVIDQDIESPQFPDRTRDCLLA